MRTKHRLYTHSFNPGLSGGILFCSFKIWVTEFHELPKFNRLVNGRTNHTPVTPNPLLFHPIMLHFLLFLSLPNNFQFIWRYCICPSQFELIWQSTGKHLAFLSDSCNFSPFGIIKNCCVLITVTFKMLQISSKVLWYFFLYLSS